MTRSAPQAAERARPAEVTLATCIGCGAMNLAGECPSGCADERKLELVPAEELDELAAVMERVEARSASLRTAVDSLASESPAHGSYAEKAAHARELLALDAGSTQRLRELIAQPMEPTVSWWCPQCGGIDAPQPCIGVCIRRPARWANAARESAMRVAAADVLARSDALAEVLSVVAHTRPRPGHERRHWEALRQRAAAVAWVSDMPPGAVQTESRAEPDPLQGDAQTDDERC